MSMVIVRSFFRGDVSNFIYKNLITTKIFMFLSKPPTIKTVPETYKSTPSVVGLFGLNDSPSHPTLRPLNKKLIELRSR